MALYQLALVLAPDQSQAAEHLKAAALVYADSGDEAREAMCYAELGHLFSKSDPDTAVFFLKQVRSHILCLSGCLRAGGSLTRRCGPHAHAQCLLLYLKLGDTHREGKVLYTIGLLALSSSALVSGSSEGARTGFNYLAQARVIFRRRGDTAEEGDACYQLGKASVRNGALEQAVKYFEEVRVGEMLRGARASWLIPAGGC